mgnify:CR=1 FL=1
MVEEIVVYGIQNGLMNNYMRFWKEKFPNLIYDAQYEKIIEDPENEIKNANYPNIRLFDVPRTVSNTPIDKIPNTTWKICSPETIKHFSAVGYFFGRDLIVFIRNDGSLLL